MLIPMLHIFNLVRGHFLPMPMLRQADVTLNVRDVRDDIAAPIQTLLRALQTHKRAVTFRVSWSLYHAPETNDPYDMPAGTNCTVLYNRRTRTLRFYNCWWVGEEYKPPVPSRKPVGVITITEWARATGNKRYYEDSRFWHLTNVTETILRREVANARPVPWYPHWSFPWNQNYVNGESDELPRYGAVLHFP